MYPLYSNKVNDFELTVRESEHAGPHLHDSLECVYVTEGSIEIGIEENLFHMEEGDFAIVFPNTIHHYQVFGKGRNLSIFLICTPSLAGTFLPTLQNLRPVNPVIKAQNLHPDVKYALETLQGDCGSKSMEDVLHQSYLQIILARIIPIIKLEERPSSDQQDIVFRIVEYVAQHFTEDISEAQMAKDLYVSPYTLSRIFSGTFHMNFNRYLNMTRLNYVRVLLEDTDRSITDIYLEAGFNSQRTFNRAFRERYRMSPAEYRRKVASKT